MSNSHKSLKGVGERSAPPKQITLLPILAIACPPRAAGAEAPRSNCDMSSVYSCVYTGIIGSTGGHCRSSPSAGSTRPSQQFSYCTRSHTVKPSTEAPRCMSGNNNDILTSELWLPRSPLKETFTESGCAVVYTPDSLCDRSVAADCVKGSYCWTNSISPDRRRDCYQPT